MNPHSCKVGSNNWAEFLPTSWLLLVLSTHIIHYHLYSLLAVPQLSSLFCMCVGGLLQLSQPPLIYRDICLHMAMHPPTKTEEQDHSLILLSPLLHQLSSLSFTVAAETATVFSTPHFLPWYNQSNLTVHCFCNYCIDAWQIAKQRKNIVVFELYGPQRETAEKRRKRQQVFKQTNCCHWLHGQR